MYRVVQRMKGPLAYPTGTTYPCCIPALGELGDVPPREGLPTSIRADSWPTELDLHKIFTIRPRVLRR